MRFSSPVMLFGLLGSLVQAHAQAPPKPAASLPWLLRSTAPTTAIRSDTVVAMFEGGTAVTTILSGSYRLRPDLALGLRLAFNGVDPDSGDGGVALANPAAVVLWAPPLGLPVQLAVTGVVVAPLGQGGGATPDAGTAAAVGSGVQTRQGMDNALFATNYLTAVLGIGATWQRGPVSVIGEATVLQLFRVRDAMTDDARTNLTTGLHIGWTFWGPLTASGELHYQRWLSTPALVEADDSRREQATWVLGVRALWKVGDVKLRPGLSYARAIDGPMSDAGYDLIQIDVPVVF